MKRDLRLAAGSGQTRRIDNVGDVTFDRSELVYRGVLEFPPPKTSG
jgi:hypothetical protein